MRGRKPKPTAIKLIQGNPGRRELPQHEPKPPLMTSDDVPDEIRADARATREWLRVVPMLRAARVMTEADRSAVIALCLQWSAYLESSDRIRKSGMVIEAPSGYPIVNPYIGIASKALGQWMKLAVELGCTPSSRSRVTTTGDTEGAEDKWAGLLG